MLQSDCILSASEDSKSSFRKEIGMTLDSILSSFSDDSAYSGIDPLSLREEIGKLGFLPEEGMGFDKTLETVRESIMPHLLRTWSTSYMPHLHSPALIESIASELIISSFNDSMDSWDQGPAATELEVHVIKGLCRLFGFPSEADGAFTSGGSQSNLSAIIAARDAYCQRVLRYDVKKKGLPECYARLRLYTSEISHFSMEKSCHLLGLGYDAVVKLPVDSSCRIDIEKAERIIEKDKEQGLLPFCIVATAGTTDFGSIDDMKAIRRIADRFGMMMHVDAAYGSGLIVSDRYRSRLDGIESADTITIDFHKMFLLPISCSAVIMRDASLLEPFELHADYLNREEDEEDGFINLVGKGIQTTRRFDALKVFMAFSVRGRKGYGEIIDKCVDNAMYFYQRLMDDDSFVVAVRPEISSVVFCLDASDGINKAIRRRLLAEGTVIGQTVKDGRTMLKFTLLNPGLSHSHIDDLIEKIRTIGRELMSRKTGQ